MAHAEVGLTPRRARANPRPADAHEVGRGGETEARVLELIQRVVGEELEAELVAVRPWLELGLGVGVELGLESYTRTEWSEGVQGQEAAKGRGAAHVVARPMLGPRRASLPPVPPAALEEGAVRAV